VKKVLVLSFLLVSMMALFVSSTSAQMGDLGGMMGDTCFGLSEADCAVINSASENMLTVTSFGQTFTLNVQMSGIQSPDMPTDVSLQASGTGPVMMVMVEETMIPNFNLPMTATFNGTTSDVSFHLVDGFAYLGIPGRTVGFAIENLGDMGGMMGGGTGDMPDMPEMPEVPGMPEMPDLGNMGDLGGMGGMLGGMLGSLPIGDYISYTRLPDADVNGMSLSPFYFNADVSGLLQSPEVSGLLSFIGPMLQGMGGGNSEIEIPAETLAILEALPTLLESLVIQFDVTQYVGQDNFIHKLTFNANVNVDMSAIAAIMPEAVEGMSGVVSVVINFDVELSGINQPVTVTAPEGAEILTEEQLKEFFEQFGPLGGMLGQ
jgi:hypothetical protein